MQADKQNNTKGGYHYWNFRKMDRWYGSVKKKVATHAPGSDLRYPDMKKKKKTDASNMHQYSYSETGVVGRGLASKLRSYLVWSS